MKTFSQEIGGKKCPVKKVSGANKKCLKTTGKCVVGNSSALAG